MTPPDLARSGVQVIEGPAGPMEVVVDAARGPVHGGIAIVAHPQPLLGGHALHKVRQVLARALSEVGWAVARPNFRGVGRSAGVHDGGVGEDVAQTGLPLAAPQPRFDAQTGEPLHGTPTDRTA